ncbi:hypothetical protein LV779_22880 [Streptomyces thinghirensis]|nr:hypothetical protein [Streptomyces thinghirensis]
MSDVRGSVGRCSRRKAARGDGRGPPLVAALAEEWGVAERPGAPGGTVWAVVAPGFRRHVP